MLHEAHVADRTHTGAICYELSEKNLPPRNESRSVATRDMKLLVIESATAQVNAAFDAGVIIPFAGLFPVTEKLRVTESTKAGRSIIQISFIVRDPSGRVLLTGRTPHDGESAPSGHGTMVGPSVLVSWSPVDLPPGHLHPGSAEDILWAYRHEVEEEEPSRPTFRWLGLIRTVAGKGVTYYMYLFEARYEKTPSIRRLRKDADDTATGFVTPDRALLEALTEKKADLRALDAIGVDVAGYDLAPSRIVLTQVGIPPPYQPRPIGVFVSHSCVDHERIFPIVERLEAEGFRCWVDKRDTPAFQEWQPAYLDALQYARAFVLIATKASQASRHVESELAQAVARRAYNAGFPIVALVLDGSSITEHLPAGFPRDRQVLDLRSAREADRAWPRLVSDLGSARGPRGTE